MKPGERIGSFTIERPLARGGMGSVYLARNDAGRRVAIKTATTTSRSQLVSLRREIRALLQVEHPAIVGVVDHGLYDAVPWIALDYVEGASLRAGVERAIPTNMAATTPLPELASVVAKRQMGAADTPPANPPSPEQQRKLLGYLATVLRGLGFLHAEGLVHRDLKPENIVVRAVDDQPILVDFGIATFAGGDRERLAHVADTAGTPLYMAPEQVLGQWTDARADLYAVGCMMFEIATGHPPYLGDSSLNVMSGHLYRDLPELPPATDPRLAQLISRLLQKEPADRPGYAHDVAAELEEILGIEVVHERVPKGYLYRADLEGREGALTTALEATKRLESDRGDAFLIAGSPGSGKTRFAVELANRVRAAAFAECLLVEMNAETTEGGPFRATLADLCDRCREKGVSFTRAVLGPDAGVLAKEYRGVLELPGVGDVEIPPNLPRKFEFLRRTRAWIDVTMRLFDGRPVVVILDELAPEYLDFLEAFRSAVTTSGAAISIFATVDDSNTDALARFAIDQVISMRRLEPDEAVRLVQSMLALDQLPSFVRSLIEERGQGNPARLADYLHMAMSRGLLRRDEGGTWVVDPDARRWEQLPPVDDPNAVTAFRLSSLPEASRALLDAVSANGGTMSIAMVSALLTGRTQLTALDPLLSEAFLVSRGESFSFADERMKSAVAAGMSLSRRRELHGKIADAMASVGHEDVEKRARHLVAAGRPDDARPLLLECARQAEPVDAVRAMALFHLFYETDPPASKDTAIAYVSGVLTAQRLGRYDETLRLCIEGERVARQVGDEDTEHRLAIERAHCLVTLNRPGAEELLDEGLRWARASGNESCELVAQVYMGSVKAIRNELHEALDCYRRGYELALQIGRNVASATNNYGAILLRLDRYDEARTVFEQMARSSEEKRNPYHLAYALGNLGVIARESDEDFGRSLELLRRAEEEHRKSYDRFGGDSALCEQLHTLVRMGRFREVFDVVERVDLRGVTGFLGPSMHLRARTALFDAFIGRGRLEQARESVGDWLHEENRPWARRRALLLTASLERRLGNYDAARSNLAEAARIDDGRVDNDYGQRFESILLDLATEAERVADVPDLPPGAGVAYPRVQRDRVLAALSDLAQGVRLVHGESPARLELEMPSTEG